MITTQHLQLLLEGRTRFTRLLDQLTTADLSRKLEPAQNSIGFLVRHIGDVELLFAKNVFQLSDISVHASTVIDQHDTGEWTDLPALKNYVEHSLQMLQKAIQTQKETDWATTVTTREFGTKTKSEALGRIVSHTAYHAGQIGLLLKYGK